MGLFDWKGTKKEDRGKKKADAVSVKVSGDKKVDKIKDEKKEKSDRQKSMKELYGKGEVAVTTKEGKKVKKERKYRDAYRVLIKPLITEKAANLGVEHKYVFDVAVRANKIEIAKAVDELYGIKPTGVNIIQMRGKEVRHGRIKGKRKDWKKAIVTLPKGKTINIYEGV